MYTCIACNLRREKCLATARSKERTHQSIIHVHFVSHFANLITEGRNVRLFFCTRIQIPVNMKIVNKNFKEKFKKFRTCKFLPI